ncbi:MAG: DegV family protein [Candidatus Promineifilaceae bacterium]
MTIRVVTDSTCDIPPETAEQYGIVIIPAYINIGDESYLDGVELSRTQFYEQLPSYQTPPTTAAPATGAFAEAYKKLAEAGVTEIISIHVATSLSGVLNAARLGAEMVKERISVTMFDSMQISMGLGLLAMAAAKAAAEGKSTAEIIEILEERRGRTHVFAQLDTLTYLRRSGRVNWAEFGIGTLLQIKPLVHVYNGEVEMRDKIRTSKRALAQMLQYVAALGTLESIALLHTHATDKLEMFRQQTQHLYPSGEELLAVEVTPAIGAHVGPGGLGIACITA